MTTSPDPSPPPTSVPELDRLEVQVLSLLAIAGPEGLSDEDLREMVGRHAGPCEAADRLVELGLAVRPSERTARWRATTKGIEIGERVL